MELIFINNINDQLNIKEETVATIGEFDGVHIAHQELIKETVKLSRCNKMASALITFEPHPDYVLGKREYEGYINPINERINIIKEYGFDYIIIVNFDFVVAALNKEEFYNKFLNKFKCLVVGNDFRFAYKGEGDVSFLKQKYDSSSLKVIDVIKNDNTKVGADIIRSSLKNGDIEHANLLLGRCFSYTGKVIEGKKLGRTWNLPTANINIGKEYIKIRKGVYACKCYIHNKYYLGIANFGNNPTCNFVEEARLEVNLIDFNDDIYGETIKVEFLKFIRCEQKFESIEKLISQINSDKDKVINEFGGKI